MSRRRTARPAAQGVPTYDIPVVCTDRGGHEPYFICTITVSKFWTAAALEAAAAVGIEGGAGVVGIRDDGARSVLTFLHPADDGAWIPGSGHDGQRDVYRFPCHRCPRAVPLRGERLAQIAEELYTAGVSQLDISALPAILGKQ